MSVGVKTANLETTEEALKRATKIDMEKVDDVPFIAVQDTNQLKRPKSGKSLNSLFNG